MTLVRLHTGHGNRRGNDEYEEEEEEEEDEDDMPPHLSDRVCDDLSPNPVVVYNQAVGRWWARAARRAVSIPRERAAAVP